MAQKTKRKIEKLKAQRKDFEKKRRIKTNNKSIPIFEMDVPILKPEKDENGNIKFKDGKAQYVGDGTKSRKIKLGHKILKAGDGVLPKSKKFRDSKKNKQIKKQLAINANAGITATGKKK